MEPTKEFVSSEGSEKIILKTQHTYDPQTLLAEHKTRSLWNSIKEKFVGPQSTPFGTSGEEEAQKILRMKHVESALAEECEKKKHDVRKMYEIEKARAAESRVLAAKYDKLLEEALKDEHNHTDMVERALLRERELEAERHKAHMAAQVLEQERARVIALREAYEIERTREIEEEGRHEKLAEQARIMEGMLELDRQESLLQARRDIFMREHSDVLSGKTFEQLLKVSETEEQKETVITARPRDLPEAREPTPHQTHDVSVKIQHEAPAQTRIASVASAQVGATEVEEATFTSNRFERVERK